MDAERVKQKLIKLPRPLLDFEHNQYFTQL